ncbi:MAG: bifunctional UDP-N-acetylglucosamine pyrophosphorylase / glucosamine-phosphate N-acetyltransferase, partial [Microbacteriaceae bacterium]|nr:bifunctional UDP-N-acetylglucosamine pyrophosphorylase / glucosamine-phosphate N-acetyltransferase [Microbacteriaceae bacterium]
MTDTPPSARPLVVVILAAGQGTRMKSSTAKVLHPLAGLPMVAHVLATAQALEPERIAVVVRHERDAVAAAIRETAPGAVIVDQDEVPGTGRAVEAAIEALGRFAGDLLVLNGDVPLIDLETLQPMLAAHRSADVAATVLTARFTDPSGYGRVLRDEVGGLERIVEHRDAGEDERLVDEVNAGVYLFRATGLAERLASLDAVNDQGERYLTDVVAALRAAGERVAAVEAGDVHAVAGINDRAQLADVARRLNDRIVRRWQLAGVTVIDPRTTWIDARVRLEEDVEIRPGTQLAGATVVERDAVIGPDTTLTDCEIGRGARVSRTDGTLAVVGPGAQVGPWAFLRPGTYLGADGKIGTFVETKNAVIGAGTKVPHLSYIGDTTVGEQSNIGAGTITANYDGVHKHRTEVGSA